MLTVFIDADACPVKEETYRVAERHGLRVLVVAHQFMRVPERDWIEFVLLKAGPDAVDDWIAEQIGPNDICITGDIPLAHRCIQKGAMVLGHKGRMFTEESIGETLAMRNLMDSLRQTGEVTGGPAPFAPKDRSRYLATLHELIESIKRQRT